MPTGKPHLSWSQINTYLLCPQSYKFSRVDHLPSPDSPAAFVGRTAHSALDFNFRQKITSGNDRKPDEVLDYFAEAWEKLCECDHAPYTHQVDIPFRCIELQKSGYPCKCTDYRPALDRVRWSESPGTVRSTGIAALRAYMADLAPQIQPAAVEEYWEISLGDDFPFTLVVILDLITVDGKILDSKFFGRMKSQQDVDDDGQLDLYSLAYRVKHAKTEAGLGLAIATRTANPKTAIISTTRTNEQLRGRIEQLEQVARGITAGVFPHQTETWKHSPKWCDFWDACALGGRR